MMPEVAVEDSNPSLKNILDKRFAQNADSTFPAGAVD